MSNTINLRMGINVVEGPSISISKVITAEAYDKIDVRVEGNEVDKVVEIQPAQMSSQIQMLLIKSSRYGTNANSEKEGYLGYKVKSTNNEISISVFLDREQLFFGQGQVGLLGDKVNKLLFTNRLGEEVTIEILVARDATPSSNT